MEKRAILAAVLMAGLLILYQVLFFPSTQEVPPSRPDKPPAQTQAPREAPPAPTPAPPPAAVPAPPRERPRLPQRTVVVDGPLYHAVVSSEGGKLQEWNLKYRGSKPMVAVGEFGPSGLQVGSDQRPPEVVSMEPSAESLALDAKKVAADLVLRGEDQGLRVTETYAFSANDFTIDARIRVENPTGAPQTTTVALPWIYRPPAKNATEKFLGQHATEVVWAASGHVERIENLAAVGNHTVDGSWMGVGSTWYLVAFIPKA